MLIYTLLILFGGSAGFLYMHRHSMGWPTYVLLATVAIIAWMCATGVIAIALDNEVVSRDGLPASAMLLSGGFVLYPVILWASAKLFERGRKS